MSLNAIELLPKLDFHAGDKVCEQEGWSISMVALKAAAGDR